MLASYGHNQEFKYPSKILWSQIWILYSPMYIFSFPILLTIRHGNCCRLSLRFPNFSSHSIVFAWSLISSVNLICLLLILSSGKLLKKKTKIYYRLLHFWLSKAIVLQYHNCFDQYEPALTNTFLLGV